MEVTFFSILLFGFILGIKYAFELAHVIAIATIVSESRKYWGSSLAGVYWGIGNTTILVLIGSILIILKGTIPKIFREYHGSWKCLLRIFLHISFRGFGRFVSYLDPVLILER